VLFGNNIDKLNSKGIKRVQETGHKLLSVGITQFCLGGHIDSCGKDSYNDRLSLRCATIVANLLANVGIPRANIETHGMGKRHPVTNNRTSKGGAENRRVTIIITP